jgi:hypothetical protein
MSGHLPAIAADTAIHPITGEIWALAETPLPDLATFMVELQGHRDKLRAWEDRINGHLLAYLDAGASWTVRVGDPHTVQYELTAPSPTAGVDVYPPDALETELRALVERGTITPDAAGKALKRQVTLVLDIPLNLPLKETADGLKRITISLGENELPVVKMDYAASAVKAGIAALRKVKGAVAGLDRAKTTSTPSRRVKVTEKTRE